MRPLCSVIMPNYQGERYVVSAIQSLQRQTLPDWELLVYDDGSTDGSISILREIAASDKRVVLLTGAGNQGPAKARNEAIKASKGRYIAFLDSDDLWKPNKLAVQTQFMLEENVAFSFSSYDRIDDEGHLLNTHVVSAAVTYRDLLKSCVIGCLTAMYDTRLLGKIYMPDIRKRQDFGLWLDILRRVEAAYPVTESLAAYRVRKNSVSSNKLLAAGYTWTVYRDVECLGLLPSTYYFAHYAIRGVLNTYVLPKWSQKAGSFPNIR